MDTQEILKTYALYGQHNGKRLFIHHSNLLEDSEDVDIAKTLSNAIAILTNHDEYLAHDHKYKDITEIFYLNGWQFYRVKNEIEFHLFCYNCIVSTSDIKIIEKLIIEETHHN